MVILAEKRASMVSRGVNKSDNGMKSYDNVEEGGEEGTAENSGEGCVTGTGLLTIMGMGSIQYGLRVRSMFVRRIITDKGLQADCKWVKGIPPFRGAVWKVDLLRGSPRQGGRCIYG